MIAATATTPATANHTPLFFLGAWAGGAKLTGGRGCWDKGSGGVDPTVLLGVTPLGGGTVEGCPCGGRVAGAEVGVPQDEQNLLFWFGAPHCVQ